jgi:peptide deformylase
MQTKVLLLGEPDLRKIASGVSLPFNEQLKKENDQLQKALEAFRTEHGFGRAIAAPQIGIPKRFIALNLGDKTFSIFNPVIQWHSPETFQLWDDCMSFPDLLVKVKRYQSITVAFLDEQGKEQIWEHLDKTHSELLQHEIDHLDGILAVDRAIDRESIVYRSVFEAKKDYFLEQVRS